MLWVSLFYLLIFLFLFCTVLSHLLSFSIAISLVFNSSRRFSVLWKCKVKENLAVSSLILSRFLGTGNGIWDVIGFWFFFWFCFWMIQKYYRRKENEKWKRISFVAKILVFWDWIWNLRWDATWIWFFNASRRFSAQRKCEVKEDLEVSSLKLSSFWVLDMEFEMLVDFILFSVFEWF